MNFHNNSSAIMRSEVCTKLFGGQPNVPREDKIGNLEYPTSMKVVCSQPTSDKHLKSLSLNFFNLHYLLLHDFAMPKSK